MTASVESYFSRRAAERKKEPRLVAVIDKDLCTSCQACATLCPVDCIFEVPSPFPTESYHQVDTSRCIGCQLCYRVPQASSSRFTLAVCPWNAVDLLVNPAVSADGPDRLSRLWQGASADLPWQRLEVYAYQLFLSGEVWAAEGLTGRFECLRHFLAPCWRLDDGSTGPLASLDRSRSPAVRLVRSPLAEQALQTAFADARELLFLD